MAAARTPHPPLFDDGFPLLLEHLALLARKRHIGLLQAEHRSHVLGSGLEFADHRAYAPGDDLRRIDWNVAARTERLLIRRFEEEEDLYVTLVVDVSGSMEAPGGKRPAGEAPGRMRPAGEAPGRMHPAGEAPGGKRPAGDVDEAGLPSRRRRALRLAAALAYIGLVNLDRVGIEIVGERVLARMPPARGRNRILRILRFLEQAPAGGGTDLETAIKEVIHRAPRRGLLLLLTDGYEERGFRRGLRLLRHEGFEGAVIRIVDLRERRPPRAGDLRVIDAESGRCVDLTLTTALAGRVAKAQARLSNRLREEARRIGFSYQERAIQEPFIRTVLRVLKGDGAVGRRGSIVRGGLDGGARWG